MDQEALLRHVISALLHELKTGTLFFNVPFEPGPVLYRATRQVANGKTLCTLVAPANKPPRVITPFAVAVQVDPPVALLIHFIAKTLFLWGVSSGLIEGVMRRYAACYDDAPTVAAMMAIVNTARALPYYVDTAGRYVSVRRVRGKRKRSESVAAPEPVSVPAARPRRPRLSPFTPAAVGDDAVARCTSPVVFVS